MSKTFRRTLSFVMCLVMLLTLLPVIPAVGAVNENTGRQDVSASDLAGKSGHVVRYSTEGTDIVKVTVGLINTDYTTGTDLSFQYDESIMKMYNYTEKKNMLSPGPAGLVFKNIPEWALSQDGKDNDSDYGFTSSKVTDMTCGFIGTDYTATSMGKDGNIRKVLATATSNVTLDADYRAMFALLDDNMRFKCLENDTVFELYDVTFKLVSGKTFDDVKYDTFDVYPESKGSSTGSRLLVYGDSQATHETPTYFVDFPGVPEPEPEYGTVSFTGLHDGFKVAMTATGKEAIPEQTVVNGSATFENLSVGNYSYTISGIGKDTQGKQYTVNSEKATGSVIVKKNYTEYVTFQTTDFTEVSYAFPLTVKVTDMKGGTVTGGTVTVNGASFSGTVAATGTLDVTVSGVEGYQDRTVQVNLTPVTDSFTQIQSLTALSAYTSFVTTAVSGGAGTITVKLSENAAEVVLPLPVPDPSGDDPLNTTDTPADSIKAQFTPKTESAKQELGQASITLSGDDITVTTDASGNITGITVNAELPAGAYDVVITGNNMKTIETTMNIIKKDNGDYVANVGGDATLENGEIKEVTGGATATEGGDGKVNFDNTVNDGATVDDKGNVSGGTPITGGITEAPSVKDELTPTTLTGPVYVVDMEYVHTDPSNPYIEATVSLKNVDPSISAGTFGIQYDATMFPAMAGKSIEDLVTLAGGIVYAAAEPKQVVYPTGSTNEPGYIVFGWTRDLGNTDWNPGDTIFTIKIFGDAATETYITTNKAFSTETVTVMPFTDTAVGKKAAADNDTAYIEQVWRTLGSNGNTEVRLEDEAAVKGGFYQITQDTSTSGSVQHDVRMEFILPEIDEIKLSVPFRVQTGKNGTFVDIQDAAVTLYADSESFAADFAAGTATAIQTIKTNSNGNVSFGVEPGTYHFTVNHNSYWAYPNGKTDTDKDGRDYDTFTIDENGVITMKNSGDNWATLNAAKEINPLMDAKSFHKVRLDDNGMTTIPKPRISSNDIAYNQQDYYFSIEPAAGYEWAESDMNDVAAALVAAKAVRFTNVDATATTEEGMYGTGDKEDITALTWNAARGQFQIAAKHVIGDPVGEDVDASVKTAAWYSPLRSGDIVITVTDDMFQAKEMTITATAGDGGKVTAKEPDPARTEGTSTYEADGTPVTSLPITDGKDKITETLNGGRTDSAVLNFKPDTSGDSTTKQTIIDKVIVNGVELQLTDAQKKDPNGFDYQFINVTGDESISVTFSTIDPTDPEEPPVPLSKPVITLVLGDHGKATANTQTYSGPTTTTITDATVSADFAVVIEAITSGDPSYQIDKVYLDDTLVTDQLTDTTLGGAANNQPTKGTLTIPAADMGMGASHSIVVTFKPLDSAESTQIVVVSSVKEDTLGTISKTGRQVYPVDYTPEYTMKPYDSLWEMKYGYEDDGTTPKTGAMLVTIGGAEADKTVDVTKDASGLYHYTMEPLTADALLVAAFNEVGHVVHGFVQIVANRTAGTDVKQAELVFERDASDTSLVRTPVRCETEKTIIYQDSGNIKVLAFTAVVPQGIWNLTVSKSGYLNCEISKFEVKTTDGEIYFGTPDGTAGSDDTIKNIILIPGDASQDGKNVGFADVGVVAAGWAGSGAKLANRVNGDLDESLYGMADTQRASTSNDMQLVINNYRRVASMSNKAYADFCVSGNAIAP